MTIQQLLLMEQRRLLTEKAQLELKIAAAPPETLILHKNRSGGKVYYKWYISDNRESRRKAIYLKRSEKETALTLARKKLHRARLKDIDQELRAIEAYFSKHSRHNFLQSLLSSPGFAELLTREFVNPSPEISQELDQWAHADYEMNPAYPEQRNVPTESGVNVRSKSEAIIFTLLSMFHIPFRYECRLDIGGHTYYPDFTIRHPLTGKYFYWEHAGRMDLPGYRSKFLNKMHVYLNNDIIPDHNLILTFESSENPLDVSIVMDKLEEFFFINKLSLDQYF